MPYRIEDGFKKSDAASAHRRHQRTPGVCVCDNGGLVWEADVVTEVIRYLDVMLNMLSPSASPLLSVSVSSHRLSPAANRTLVDTGGMRKAAVAAACGGQSYSELFGGNNSLSHD